MYRVLLVDDQPIFRDIFRGMLDAAGGFEVIGEAPDGSDAVNAYSAARPDLVLMDVQMARMNGFQATARILEDHPDAAVILTSMRQDKEFGRMAKEAGALDFFPKRNLDVEEIRALLEMHIKNISRRERAA